VYGDALVSGRFNLVTNCDKEIPRLTIKTQEQLEKLIKFFQDINKENETN
jgi:hypothetical protein